MSSIVHFHVRMFLAMYLAIWSPAVCCCTMMGTCRAQAAEQSSALRDCCATNEQSDQIFAAARCCGSASADRDHTGDSLPDDRCNCAERRADRVAAAVWGKIELPKPAMQSMTMSMPDAAGCLASPLTLRRLQLPNRAHPPPLAGSLHARGCLLLI